MRRCWGAGAGRLGNEGLKPFQERGCPTIKRWPAQAEVAVVTGAGVFKRGSSATAPTRRRVWKTLHGLAHVASGVAGHSHSHALKTGEIRRMIGW
ncbi:MAG: hypothetical protein R3B95_04690 [Nitrospirales bacterium]|nr:hypothetical protein [Nitrospirales bacterium]